MSLELVSIIISHVDAPIDLLHCACVNRIWNELAMRRLYRGSMHDKRFRTPDVGWLNSLYVASPERFTRNVRFIKHLLIAHGENGAANRLFHDRQRAELLLRPNEKGPTSLAIPFEFDHDIYHLRDLIFHPDLKFLTIDLVYCRQLMSYDSISPSVSPLGEAWFIFFLNRSQDALKPQRTFIFFDQKTTPI